MKKLSWLEKLNKSLEVVVNDDIRTKIIEGSETLTSGSSSGKKAKWVKTAMERMDSFLDEETGIKVMEQCSCIDS